MDLTSDYLFVQFTTNGAIETILARHERGHHHHQQGQGDRRARRFIT